MEYKSWALIIERTLKGTYFQRGGGGLSLKRFCIFKIGWFCFAFQNDGQWKTHVVVNSYFYECFGILHRNQKCIIVIIPYMYVNTGIDYVTSITLRSRKSSPIVKCQISSQFDTLRREFMVWDLRASIQGWGVGWLHWKFFNVISLVDFINISSCSDQ